MSKIDKLKTFSDSLVKFKRENQEDEAQNQVWDSKKIKEAFESLSKGEYYEMGNPYYDGRNIGKLRAGDIVYKHSKEEIKEFKKCAKDIIYFAENYCKIKTEEGQHTHFNLRDYQKKFLNLTKENNYCIYLSSRQIGKCLLSQERITIETPEGDVIITSLGDLYNTHKEKLTTFQKIKTWLWKRYQRI